MKPTNLLSKIIRIVFPMFFILLFSFSCRKEIKNPGTDQPVQEVPLPALTAPTALAAKPVNILSQAEIDSKKVFPAQTINMVGSGITKGGLHEILGPITEVGGLIFEIWEYKKTEARFDAIDEKLTNLQDQIADLNNTVKEMGASLNISIDDQTAFIASLDLSTYITGIQTAMGSAMEDQFMYYSRTAKAYQADPTNPIMIARMDALKKNAPYYAYKVFHGEIYPPMTDCIMQIHKDLLLPVGKETDALHAYAKTLISKFEGVFVDSTSAMEAYRILESYFLTVVNYQFQAATIMMNAANMLDTTGVLGYAPDYWKYQVSPLIIDEINVFRSSVDYLVVNLAEYRNQNRFVFDMQYIDQGIAPDRIFYHVLARAQFVSNLLSLAAGVSYPAISGHALVPNKYVTNPRDSITIKVGDRTLKSAPTIIQSQIPYTYWVNGVCNPDYRWNVYNFVTPNSDQDWPTTPQTIQVVDGPLTQAPWSVTPWVHSKPITGSVTPIYYNPINPSQTSVTKTDICNFEFAYFAGVWQWGDMYLSNSIINDSWFKITNPEKNYFNFSEYNKPLSYATGVNEINTALVPFAATSDKYSKLYYETNGIYYSNQDGKTGTLVLTGSTSYTSKFFVVVDGNYTNVTTGTDVPPKNGNLKSYVNYTVGYGMKGNGGDDLTVSIGTERKIETINYNVSNIFFQKTEINMPGNIIRTNWHNQAGNWNKGYGTLDIKPGTAYQPGIQYYFQTANLPNIVPANITFSTNHQFVYGGFGDIPK